MWMCRSKGGPSGGCKRLNKYLYIRAPSVSSSKGRFACLADLQRGAIDAGVECVELVLCDARGCVDGPTGVA